jgi:hypothetical protein
MVLGLEKKLTRNHEMRMKHALKPAQVCCPIEAPCPPLTSHGASITSHFGHARAGMLPY